MDGLRQVSAALDPSLSLQEEARDTAGESAGGGHVQTPLRQISRQERRQLSARLRQASRVGPGDYSDSESDGDDTDTESIDDAYEAEYSVSIYSRIGIFSFTVVDTCFRSFIRTIGDHPTLVLSTVLQLSHIWSKDPQTGTLSACETTDAGGVPWKGALSTAISWEWMESCEDLSTI